MIRLAVITGVAATVVGCGSAGSGPSSVAGDTQAKAGAHAERVDYGMNFKALSKAIGFVVPELTSLDGYPLLGSSVSEYHGPAGEASSGRFAAIVYGNKGTAKSTISIDIGRRSKPGAWGTIYSQMYAEKRFRHFPTTPSCPAYTLVSGDVVTPYHSEWMGVHTTATLTRRGWCRLLRAIERR